ncbi:MAG TPA: polyribonucleotide nucleotidyltransferase [Candidatus Nitrosocosmicus sp.]|nr:polyribonucleotide nucleotidyltransferase [Candidatus Nitrosocosmicus sp.]
MNITEESILIDDKKLTLQVGKLAQTVDTSVLGRLGDTVVLVTVAVGPENPAIDYFPLSVEYAERLYAGGRIKGSRWVKREGRPSDESILTGRLIDRSIRPLFPKSYKKQVQVVATLMSVDGVNSPDVVAAITAAAAVHLSSIPWDGPISTMRVGYVKDENEEKGTFIINPDDQEQKLSELDLMVSSSENKVVMLETKAQMIPHEIIEEAIERAKEENRKIIEFIDALRKKIGKEKEAIPEEKSYEDLLKVIDTKYAKEVEALIENEAKHGPKELLTSIVDKISADLGEEVDKKDILIVIEKHNYKKIKADILEKKKRPDGRPVDGIRDLYIEASILPRTHGSAIFQRGQTQLLSVATLGSSTLEQLIEGPEGEEAKRYIHYYSDGPYSYGGVGRMGSPSRRAIGHGALAEKAVEPVLPSKEDFPYAIQVISEVLSENGSSSMGSISGSSLALMDAGVPIKSAVAGIAMGIITGSDDNYVVLSDIIALEDFAGEMDFKVAGTKEGVTAIQLDVKNKGLTSQMIKDIFNQAKAARLHILEAMNKVIDKPRKQISKYAPKVVMLTPPSDKIGEIIGPGGKNIKSIIAKTGTQIDISDDGKVSISGVDATAVEKAAEIIENIYRPVEIGSEFEGEVKRILPFGAFVEMSSGKEGMVHVSKMGKGFVKDPHDVVAVGDKVHVKVLQVDQMGRINLAMTPEKGTSEEE